MYDLELIQDTSKRAYLKRMAIDAVLNFVGRSISQTHFRVYEKGELNKSDWHYKLNVRPNTDMSASTFWQKVAYKLLYDNEVLIVVSDTEDLLIADTFERKEYALFEDVFHDVTVKDYTFKRTFKMNEVIYMEYNNDKLERFINELFGDYGELFGRMIDVSLRNNQLRATVDVDTTGKFDEQAGKKLQNYIDKLFASFTKNSVAIVPQTKGFTYNEVSNNSSGKSQSIDEITKIKNEFITDVAKMVGVPPALIHGEMADLEANRNAYIEFCVKPLIKKIQDELNAKLFEPHEFLEGCEVKASGIDKKDIFDLANAIEKLTSSGNFNSNTIREELGYEPREGGEVYHITKNFQTDEEAMKGGDANNEED